MPTVEMKLPLRNAPSLNRMSTQVFPTPLSPINITCVKKDDNKLHADHTAVCGNNRN